MTCVTKSTYITPLHVGNLSLVNVTIGTVTASSIQVNIGSTPTDTRVIIGYERLGLGLPVYTNSMNNRNSTSYTISSLAAGSQYKITVWRLNFTDRAPEPTVFVVSTASAS